MRVRVKFPVARSLDVIRHGIEEGKFYRVIQFNSDLGDKQDKEDYLIDCKIPVTVYKNEVEIIEVEII